MPARGFSCPSSARCLALLLAALPGCGDDGGGATTDAAPGDGGANPDAALSPLCASPDAAVTVADLRLRPVATGLTNPVFVTAPAGDERLFVVEQPGRIRVITAAGLEDTPYLNIQADVDDGGSEEGLLGLAFHPDFAENGRFYVNYTANDQTVIEELTAADPAANALTPTSQNRRVVLTVGQDFQNHNGGMIAFGPDGYLYIGMGDGGSGGDPNGRAQDLSSLLGKLLRIDVDDTSSGEYGIPDGNPVGETGQDEIYAWGLRNPWRWSFDRMTGDFYVADVGQNRIEEVSVVSAADLPGADFGWDEWEGSECFYDQGNGSDDWRRNLGEDCTTGVEIVPVAEYGHTGGSGDYSPAPVPDDQFGDSITGGYVYRGSCYPSVQGTYFYGDFVTSGLRSFVWSGETGADSVTENTITSTLAEGVSLGGIASFGEDGFGELYMTSFNGTVYRLAPESD